MSLLVPKSRAAAAAVMRAERGLLECSAENMAGT